MRSGLTLVLSLALTGALVAMNVALHRARQAAPGTEPERKLAVTTKRLVRQLPPPPVTTGQASAPAFRWDALESADYATYAANLRAIGCPERTLRDILLPDIEQHYAERKAALAADTQDHFWETADQRDARERDRVAKSHALELEKRGLIRKLLGADWNYAALKELRGEGFGAALMELLVGYTDLPRTEHVFMTHQMAEVDVKAFQAATEGIYLDEDFPKLQALRDRFEADLARGLAPTELEELRLRIALLAGEDFKHLRRNNGVNVTGAELREVARLRAETKDMWADVLDLDDELFTDELKAKADAAFTELLRRFLGPERFADAERAKDGLFRDLYQSTENQGVAKAGLVSAYEARRAAEGQADEIRDDAQLSAEERAVLLATLRAQTAQALSRSLGPVGYSSYMKAHGEALTNTLSLPRASAGELPPIRPPK